MTAKQLTYILSVLVGLLVIVLVASGYVANMFLTHKATELGKIKAQSQVVVDRQNQLKKDIADIARYSPLNEIARAVVPQDKSQAQTVTEIVNIAAASGIPKLSSITFPASTLGGSGSASSTASLTQVTPVKNISGVYSLPITITQDSSNTVPYDQFLTFLKKLESNRRTAQLSSVNVQPDNKNPSRVSFVIVVNEYIKP